MSDGRLVLPLESKVDANGKRFYFTKIKAPITIDCSEKNGGLAILIFTSDEGQEEIHFCHINKPKNKDDDK